MTKIAPTAATTPAMIAGFLELGEVAVVKSGLSDCEAFPELVGKVWRDGESYDSTVDVEVITCPLPASVTVTRIGASAAGDHNQWHSIDLTRIHYSM